MAQFFKLCLPLFLLSTVLFAQSNNIKFEHISVEQGLSQSTVQCIFQDSQGFMWFGTEDGLNKFDGYKFTIYKHDPEDSASLASNYVWDIYEDYSTNLWIATAHGGLNRFDRETEEFTHYKFDPKNPASISYNTIRKITGFKYGDREVLWIGTGNGLNKFDLETEQFSHFPPTDQDFPYNFVETMVVDSSGKVWIGCTYGGLHRFDPETEKYVHYRHDPKNHNTLSSDPIWSLLVDQSGVLWIGTSGGELNKFDSEIEQFTRYRCNPGNRVFSIYEDKEGVLWIGTWEGELNIFDRKTEQFTQYKHDPHKPYSLSINSITSIYQDKSDVIWIGTWQGGLNKINPQSTQFTHPELEPYLEDLNLPVWGICESEPGVLWVGIWGEGLVKIDRKQGQVSCFHHDPNNPNSLSDDLVGQIIRPHQSGRDVLWIGTYNGLNKLDLNTEQITRYYYDPDVTFNAIRSIYEDKSGVLWIGTHADGLIRFDRKTKQFTRVGGSMQIMQLFEDKSGVLWIAAWSGLKKLDRETEQFTTYLHDPNDINSISNNQIISIYESSFQGKDMLWVGTSGGLNKFDRELETFISYTTKDGLPNDVINGILEDNHGNLWLSTNNGISKFNPESETFRNYNVRDGLRSNQFVTDAYFQSSDGEMFFGGTKGLDAFYPDNIKDNPWIPPVVITDFQIFNKPVKIKRAGSAESDNDYFLPKNINTIQEIKLSYKENVFSFEFAALDYRNPRGNKYAYKMEGVDPDWVYTDASRRFATYTQLSPGEYIFKVKGSNNDNIWNEKGTSVKIIITPPWWKTYLAYFFYILLFGSILFAIWRFQTNRLKMKHELELEHVHAEKLEEVDLMKSRFFANISHEFRTPLTLIQGPIKQMLSDEFKGNFKEQYRTILRYSNRLLDLINQILDLSKLESGRMTLRLACTNVTQFLKGIVQSFASLAERKKITLKFKTDDESMIGYVDRDKLEKIVTNLLSNAFKFTPEGGNVEVGLSLRGDMASARSTTQSPLSEGDEIATSRRVGTRNDSNRVNSIEIKIFNTGTIIPPDQLENIFDRFYQADESYTKDNEGTGIGLALTKELVEAHHGEIGAESELNKGTTFMVLLPVEKEYFKPEEIVEEPLEDERIFDIPLSPPASPAGRPSKGDVEVTPLSPPPSKGRQGGVAEIIPDDATKKPSEGSTSAPLLLIVEDNPDVTTYISSFLEKDYRIITAENGEAGWKTVLEKFPDLIISDVMMPVMDGFELCKKLKSDENTSHIPVILLTAKADMDSKIEGLEFGADDYITKPFDAKELSVRSKNLLEQRQRLREHFEQEVDLHP
jgi:signal transduction histidine kinase/ligand-binding sensor domain-containing protein/ActR/RegA family two-component response regulator